jgi:hypothetical protein
VSPAPGSMQVSTTLYVQFLGNDPLQIPFRSPAVIPHSGSDKR